MSPGCVTGGMRDTLQPTGSKLAEAWAELPESVKDAVLEMVRG